MQPAEPAQGSTKPAAEQACATPVSIVDFVGTAKKFQTSNRIISAYGASVGTGVGLGEGCGVGITTSNFSEWHFFVRPSQNFLHSFWFWPVTITHPPDHPSNALVSQQLMLYEPAGSAQSVSDSAYQFVYGHPVHIFASFPNGPYVFLEA